MGGRFQELKLKALPNLPMSFLRRASVFVLHRPGEPLCPQTAAELQHLQSPLLLPPSSGWPQTTATAFPAALAGVAGKWDSCQGNVNIFPSAGNNPRVSLAFLCCWFGCFFWNLTSWFRPHAHTMGGRIKYTLCCKIVFIVVMVRRLLQPCSKTTAAPAGSVLAR